MNIVIRLEKLGQNLKKIDDCRSGRSSWTKGELIVKKVRVVRVNENTELTKLANRQCTLKIQRRHLI